MAEAQILLADDDDVGRYVIATMLRRAGFGVIEAADGHEAVATARRDPPDLAVLDVKMPTMDGFEACRRLRADTATRDIPVLLLSATFHDAETRVEGLETGADAYLTQPVEAPVLAATVRALLRSRNAEAEVRLAAAEWRATFDAISEAVAVFDAEKRLLRANRVFTELFGENDDGGPVPALIGVVNGDEIEHDGRLFRVRVDRITGDDTAEREVVTLSDITAARAIERERAAALATERLISRTLQQSLLPERLPDDPRLELHAWHVAAETELIIGGDWYDVVDTAESRWLVMGDVAGHGVAAAAQAGQLRHSLRVYANEGYNAIGTLERLNEIVTNQDPAEMATVCIVTIDPDVARVVRAGHPPVLLVPAAGPPRFVDGDPGVVLGIRGAHFTETVVPFGPGDRLVLYTDGLVERRNESLDVGLERLRASADGVGGLSALRAHLVRALTGGDSLRDDVALLLARRR